MRFLSRLLGTGPDPREALRPLWHRVVAISRAPHWYREGGVADTMDGRFDMITLVLALVMIRLEQMEGQRAAPARLTELFMEDMEGQMRESGIGDPTVGKRIGTMVSALGGRLGALRSALEQEGDLGPVLTRNVNFADGGGDPARLGSDLTALHARLSGANDADVLAGEIA